MARNVGCKGTGRGELEGSEQVGAQLEDYMHSSGQRDRQQDIQACALGQLPAP